MQKKNMRKLTVKSARIVWEVIRTEAGLPTRVTQNFNADKVVDFSTVKKDLLNKLKKKKK